MKRGIFGSSRRRPLQDKAQSIANRKKQKICTLSRQRRDWSHARPSFFSGRADNACTNLLDFLVRYVRTRGIVKIAESGKTTDFTFVPLPHALATHYFLRLTRARGKSSQREGNALFDDFWYFSSLKSTIKKKLLYVSSRVVEAPTPVSATPTHMLRICVNSPTR